MNDPNRLTKWLFVTILVVLALVVLYPPSEKLKGGIDLVGGTSLLFEIDTSGLDARQQRDLSVKVMDILRERVDPKGQLNLEWRPIGNTRLEIRMPRPPKEALERRVKYNEALARLETRNLRRFDVEQALNAIGTDRVKLSEELGRGVPQRKALIAAVAEAYDALTQAQDKGETESIGELSDRYATAVSDLLATSLPINRLTDILALREGDKRTKALEQLREQFPAYDAGEPNTPDGTLLTKAIAAYDAWAADKADLEDPSDLKRRLRGAGVLEFRILADRDPSSPEYTYVETDPQLRQPAKRYVDQLQQYGPRPKAGDRYAWFPIEDVTTFLQLDNLSDYEATKSDPGRPITEEYAGRYYVLAHSDPQYGLLREQNWKLKNAMPEQDPLSGKNIVSFRLDTRGGQLFGHLTENNLKRNLCIMLDNSAMSFARIKSRITEAGIIEGNFTPERVQDLVRVFQAGSLPARLRDTPLMENTIGPSLGETNRTKGIRAAVWGAVMVGVFVLFYYGIAAGGVANIALALNLLFVLAIMALLQATFTLPGIAGLILTVGMAIDANVLIFERIREERDRGVVFKRGLNAGYDKAFSTIFDANLTTLITCVILGFVGSDEVKGFAITLGIGISTSMFTALFVTRLIFNTLIVKGMLKDLSMRRIIGCPQIDWLALRRTFWPVSTAVVVAGLTLFVYQSTAKTQSLYDIEFLGGTSLQVDLKPDVAMSDEEMKDILTADRGSPPSAAAWLREAADRLAAAEAIEGTTPGRFTLRSPDLTGEQLAALLRNAVEDKVERGGLQAMGREVVINGKVGELTLDRLNEAKIAAADYVRKAADRLRSARVQSVGTAEEAENTGKSYEIVTVETDRELVQASVLAVLGDKLSVQRAIAYSVERDKDITMDSFFVIETSDRFLADVIGGNANFDIRPFRGGTAVVVNLDESEEPIPISELEKRLRQVGLQPEFEQYRTRESRIYGLGGAVTLPSGQDGFKRFAILAADDTLRHDDDPTLWTGSLAKPHLAQVEAALGQEKSLSKVIQFAAPIAAQTRNRAMFAIVLALSAIIAYLWLRFGTKEYGLAASVALVHDVAITLGLVALSHYIYNSFVGRALLVDSFRVDLPMIAAILTVIGYSLNDTIVVFDRIRENKGRVESLNPRLINASLNQTLSRTLLTSITTFLVVIVLYAFGGTGVHGFSFALLIGVVVGTYSSLGIATPLLYRTHVLHGVVVVIVAAGLIGIVFAATDRETLRWVLSGLTALVCVAMLIRTQKGRPGLAPRHAVSAS